MKRFLRRVGTVGLFAALALLLLYFQGLLGGETEGGPPTSVWRALAAGERTARAEGREAADRLVYPATVEAVDPAEVRARTSGIVVSVEVREGDAVAAGDRLASLDPTVADARVAQARAALEGAEARSKAAALAFARAQELLDKEATTRADWEDARAARDTAAAGVSGAKSALDEALEARGRSDVLAPVDGTVAERRIDPGDLATPGEPLFELFVPGRLRLAADLPEDVASGLATGDTVEVEIGGDAPRTSTVLQVLPSADPATGTVTVRVALEVGTRLRPGQDARIAVASGRRTATFVPAGAIRRVGQVERALLVRDGRVLPVSVRVGKRAGEQVEVLSGLEPGDEVVVP